jgi:serine/threonine protein kinase
MPWSLSSLGLASVVYFAVMASVMLCGCAQTESIEEDGNPAHKLWQSVSHDSVSAVSSLPDHSIVKKLGSGMSGSVDLVRLDNGFEAALKCSSHPGHPLLRGYGHMLDTQGSEYFARVYGYYKLRNSGDCVFMELTGLTLAQLRKASGSEIWPSATIASIGLQLLRGFYEMHEKFNIGHRDANPSNLVVAKTLTKYTAPHRAMIIDFDFSQSIHANELKVFDIRQLLVSLRYLYDGDATKFWNINPSTGGCSGHHNIASCTPGPVSLCAAIQYACRMGINEKVNYKHIEKMLTGLLGSSQDKDTIIWPNGLWERIAENLD